MNLKQSTTITPHKQLILLLVCWFSTPCLDFCYWWRVFLWWYTLSCCMFIRFGPDWWKIGRWNRCSCCWCIPLTLFCFPPLWFSGWWIFPWQFMSSWFRRSRRERHWILVNLISWRSSRGSICRLDLPPPGNFIIYSSCDCPIFDLWTGAYFF